MGQQQLILLVLGIVIVGLAVVVGIQSFNENRQKTEIDNLTSVGVGMAGEIIGWYQKPTSQGGAGSNPANFDVLTIDKLGYDWDRSEDSNFGGYTMTATVANNTIRYVGQSRTHPFLHMHAMPRAQGVMRVEVHVFGPFPGCVVSRHSPLGTGVPWSDGKSETAPPDNPDPARCVWPS